MQLALFNAHFYQVGNGWNSLKMKIINVMATSLDGGTAMFPGETDGERHAYEFSSKDDYEFVVDTIRSADAVVVGKSTFLAGGVIDVKNNEGIYPEWYIFTNRGFTIEDRPTGNPVPVTLVSRENLPAESYPEGGGKLFFGVKCPAKTLIEHLEKKGKKRVLLLGGGTLNQLFYKEGLVDELFLTLCPIILGSETAINLVKAPLPAPVRLTLKSSKVSGNLVFLKYRVQNKSRF